MKWIVRARSTGTHNRNRGPRRSVVSNVRSGSPAWSYDSARGEGLTLSRYWRLTDEARSRRRRPGERALAGWSGAGDRRLGGLRAGACRWRMARRAPSDAGGEPAPSRGLLVVRPRAVVEPGPRRAAQVRRPGVAAPDDRRRRPRHSRRGVRVPVDDAGDVTLPVGPRVRLDQ